MRRTSRKGLRESIHSIIGVVRRVHLKPCGARQGWGLWGRNVGCAPTSAASVLNTYTCTHTHSCGAGFRAFRRPSHWLSGKEQSSRACRREVGVRKAGGRVHACVTNCRQGVYPKRRVEEKVEDRNQHRMMKVSGSTPARSNIPPGV